MVAAAATALAATAALADTDVFVFWQRGCQHCRDEIRYLERVATADATVHVHYFEVRGAVNRQFYGTALEQLRVDRLGLPLTAIGTTALVGYRDDASTGAEILALIADCARTSCTNALAALPAALGAAADRALARTHADLPPTVTDASAEPATPNGAAVTASDATERRGLLTRVRLPWVGEVDLSRWSLPVLTVTLAAVDGFNPCAMWVLVFLIGLLLGLHDSLRRWLLGGTFLLTTALVYYVLIAAWLNAVLVLGLVTWLRIAIGLAAIGGGIYYAYGYWRSGAALCRVTNPAKRQRVMSRLRAAVAEPRFIAAAVAVAALAIGVNFIELLCSAGLPAVYTQVLALTPMPAWQYHAWLALYVLVFLADDLAIFATAMITLQVTGAAQRYAHRAQLVGAIVLLAIGVLLVARPESLRFG